MTDSFIATLKAYLPRKGSFLAHALTLMTGTTLAQGLMIASAPVLTRLYSPEDFGIMGVFISLSSMIAIVACGRYENAILLPKKEEDAANVLGLAISITLGISLLILLVVLLFRHQIAGLLKNPELATWFWWVPVTVFMTGLYQACNFWSSRKKQFHRLAISRVSNSIAIVGTQLGAGVLTKGGPAGLIAGQVLGWVVGAGVLVSQLGRQDLHFLAHSITKNKMYQQARVYYRFPLIDSWAILANYGAQKIPILILNQFFDTMIVGYYFLGYRVLSLPLGFVTDSISQVFFEKYEAKRKTQGKSVFLLRIIKVLSFSALLPAIILFIFSPSIFQVCFGEKWTIAGTYVRILIPLFFFRFIVSPISAVLWSEGKNLWLLVWQTIFFLGTLSAFLIGGLMQDVKLSLILYSLFGSILYLLLTCSIYIISKNNHNVMVK